MSAVSGLTSKGENKSKQKYQSLNINNLYKGKSLETQKTSVAPKHGLQTLGKVGAGRRMPPPANLPSLKSQISGNPNINLVPTGGQGWGSGKEEDSGATPPLQTSSSGPEVAPMCGQRPIPSNPLVMSSSATIVPNVGAIAGGLASAALAAASKTWNTSTAPVSEESGPDKSYLAQQSPFFPQEFPKLDGGNVPQDGTTKAGTETSYGPGPALRPQTEGSWGRGTLPQPNANQPPNAGSGGSGGPATPPLQPNDPNVQNLQMTRGLYPQPMSGLPPQRPPIPGSVPVIPSGNQAQGQTPMNYNQYRMMAQYPPHMAYPRGAYPSGSYPQQGYPQPHGPINPRQPYYPDSRSGQQMEDDSGGRPRRPAPPIITDKDLKGFDEILENEVQSGWAAANTEIDYNAKLVFSDDEDTHPSKESSFDESRERNDPKQRDWDRRDYDERREDRPKYRPPPQHPSHPPHPSQQVSQPIPTPRETNVRVNNYEYPQHSSQSAQYSRQQMHSNYSHSRHNRSEPPIVADEDEMWRQRSRQQSDEMAAAVIRARQRREEEEKEIARSRQAAHEKLKALEEKSLKGDRERTDSTSLDFDQCSRHSSDSKDEKLSTRDPRDPRFANSFQANKVYPKNVPPRFQKQAELMRQTQQSTGPPTHSPPFEQRYNRPSESDPREIRTHANNSQPPNKAQPLADVSRSNSQISSGHESYDSERRTPDDRRPRQSSQSGSESKDWRAVQSRHSMSDSKDSTASNSRPIDDRDGDKQILIQRDKKTEDKIEFKEIKPKVDSNENFSEKRTLIERQESSHSDKRSTSSKEDRYTRKYERLDWAAESESLMVNNSFSQKRDHPRHRPITQKEFESFTEPIKKNFTPLKKNNLSNISPICDEHKDSSVHKTKEDFRKSETPPLSVTNVDNLGHKTKPMETLKALTNREESRVEHKDIERQYDRTEKESSLRDLSKDDKNSRKSSHSLRYGSESYGGRGRYSGQSSYRGTSSRGREYRRTRQSSEKSYTDSKPSSSPSGGSRNKSNKFVRRKSNSDESCVSEEIKRESKLTTDSSFKDKLEDDLDKSSDIVMSSSASATVPNQRNESVSRRGRGAAAFRVSTRGMPRAYVPSNYGPPPSRAAFGDGVMKSESDRSLDQNRNEKNFETRNSGSKTSKDEINSRLLSGQSSNQFHDNNRNSISNSRKTNAFSGRSAANSTNFSNNNSRSETLPPRFQKRHNRGSRSDRSRPERSGSSNQNESDLANNEEWETASESSDVADRNDRKTKKSSSDPRNDNRHNNRKSDKRNDNPRGQHSTNSGTQSSNYRRDGRNTRGQNNSSNSRQNNSNQRNGQIGSSNHSENIIVCAVSDLTLDNPKAIEEALTDIKNRNKTSSDSIEDQISETEDGFQTVSYKKRNRLNQGNDSKKFKHELSPKSKALSTVRSTQRKLPPRFAKQKENNRLNTFLNEAFPSNTKLVEDIKSLSIGSKTNETTDKAGDDKTEMTVQTKAVPNAWNKPLSHSSQTITSSSTVMTSTKTATSTTNSISHDIQALSVSSKSSSFDQHDSGIDVSDQPPSTASSQRSSPSNDDNKLITTTAKVTAITEVRAEVGTDIDAAKPMCTVIFENTRYKEENKVLAKIAPAKSPSAKDMYVSTTSVTTNLVTETSRMTQSIISPKKIETVLNEDFSANDKIQSPNVAKVVGMQRTNVLAPTESELNKKIASVKSVWESPSITTTIDSKSENSKNILLNTLMTTNEDKKLMSNESHTSDSIHVTKVPERTAPKVEYSMSSSVETINSLAKSKTPSMAYSTQTQNQSYVSHSTQSQQSLISSQQMLLNAISSPPLTETHRPHSGHQQFQVHNMATSPAISTPPTMLYNSHVAAHNVYQAFAPQMDNLHQTQMPAVMAQFGHQHSSAHYGQHLLQPQQNQLNAANIFMAHQLAAQPSAADQFKFNAQQVVAQQSLAKSLLSNQFVHQNNTTLQQTLSNAANWTAPTAHNQTNNQNPNYYPQSSSVGTALQAHQQHFAFQSQPSLGLMSAPQQQQAAALVQQSYRATPLSMGRQQAVDASNPMAANLRSMFAGNIINDMKIGNTVNQSLDNRNANQRTAFNYNQSAGLQQLQHQQHTQQMFANQQKFTGRAILPIYAQQMLGQTAISGRPNSASMVSSNVNSANSYTTPIQRPKLNRNNQSYNKSSHPTHHLSAPQIPHQAIHPTHPTHITPHPQQVVVSQSSLSSAAQAKMRQEAVRQTQSFFAQSSIPSTKNESQHESQSCGEVSADSLTSDCVNSDNKMSSIDKNE